MRVCSAFDTVKCICVYGCTSIEGRIGDKTFLCSLCVLVGVFVTFLIILIIKNFHAQSNSLCNKVLKHIREPVIA